MMSSLPFWKMHGAGNDFVVLAADDADAPWGTLAERVCDRHFGVGADGLIVALPSERADRRMRIFNADGSEAEMCGNGIRCLVKFVLEQGLADAPDGRVRIETIPGVLKAVATRGASGASGTDGTDGADGRVARVRVAMGAPSLEPAALGAHVEQAPPLIDLPLEAAGTTYAATLVSMGNPHAVLFTDAPPADFELERVGPALEHHPLFERRTNVEGRAGRRPRPARDARLGARRRRDAGLRLRRLRGPGRGATARRGRRSRGGQAAGRHAAARVGRLGRGRAGGARRAGLRVRLGRPGLAVTS